MHADDLPEGWTSAPLAKVTRLSKEKWTPGTGEDRRYLSLEHIEAHTGRLLGHGSSDDVKSAKNVYDAGDVLYGKLRPYLSKVARPDAPGVCSTDILVFKPSEQLEQGYLNALLQSHAVTTHAMDHAKGINLPRVSPKALGTFETPVPPLPEQRRIVTRLDAIEAHRRAAKEKLDRLPDLLDRYRQSVLAATFRGELTAAWREAHPDTEPASALLKRIRAERRRRLIEINAQKSTDRAEAREAKKGNVWSDADRAARLDKERVKAEKKYKLPDPVDESTLPDLPAGWLWVSAEELTVSITDGVHKKPVYLDSGVPFLSVKNLTAGPGISFEDTRFVSEEDHAEFIKRTHPEQNDVLVSKDGTLGVVRLIETDAVFSVFVSLALVKPALRSMGRFMSLVLQEPATQGRIVHTGSGLQHIHLRDLRALPVPVPPEAEQVEISRLLSDAFERTDQLAETAERLNDSTATLRQATLARAFRGELVPTDAALARLDGDTSRESRRGQSTQTELPL